MQPGGNVESKIFLVAFLFLSINIFSQTQTQLFLSPLPAIGMYIALAQLIAFSKPPQNHIEFEWGLLFNIISQMRM